MEQKAGDGRRPGRPPAFDRRRVVDGAMRAFWSTGYGRTSLATLEKCTGADRSTLYNSFGGKAGLYREAVAAYVDIVESEIFAPLHRGSAGVADLLDFLDRLGAQVSSLEHPPGCLVVNDLVATGHDRTSADRYLARLDQGIRQALDRSALAGETDPAAADHRARTLVAAVLGVNLAAAAGADGPAGAAATVDGLRSLVASWRQDDRSPLTDAPG